MGFSLAGLIGGSVGQAANGVASAINQFVETPEEKKAAEVLLMKVQQEPDKWQAEINKIEAGHSKSVYFWLRQQSDGFDAFALGWGWILAPILAFLFPEKKYQP